MFTLLKLINNGVIDDEFILYCDVCERIIKNNYAIKKNGLALWSEVTLQPHHEKSVKHNILLSLMIKKNSPKNNNYVTFD